MWVARVSRSTRATEGERTVWKTIGPFPASAAALISRAIASAPAMESTNGTVW